MVSRSLLVFALLVASAAGANTHRERDKLDVLSDGTPGASKARRKARRERQDRYLAIEQRASEAAGKREQELLKEKQDEVDKHLKPGEEALAKLKAAHANVLIVKEMQAKRLLQAEVQARQLAEDALAQTQEQLANTGGRVKELEAQLAKLAAQFEEDSDQTKNGSAAAAAAPSTETLAGAIEAFLASDAARSTDHEALNQAFIEATSGWIQEHGVEAVKNWSQKKLRRNKNKHRLVHLAAAQNLGDYIAYLADAGFDLNVQRPSDGLTPLHVALWYKKSMAADQLKNSGADLTMKNNYGEDCSAKYEALVNSYSNLIFLDLETTQSSWTSNPATPSAAGAGAAKATTVSDGSRILEAAVIVTDKDLNELGRGQWVISGFTKEELEALPPFHQRNLRDPVCQEEGSTEGETQTAEETQNQTGSEAAAAAQAGAGAGPKTKRRHTNYMFPPLEEQKWGGNGLFSDVMDPSQAKPLEQAQKEILALIANHCAEGACALAGCSVRNDRELLRFQMPKVYAHLSHRVVDCSTVLEGMIEPWCSHARYELSIRYAVVLERFKRKNHPNVSYTHRALDDCESAIVMMKWMRERFFEFRD